MTSPTTQAPDHGTELADKGTEQATELIDALSEATDARAGLRVSHPKGVLLKGTFTGSARAGSLTRAAHLQGPPVRVTVRFSNASTDPDNHDAAVGEPRGMSVKFYLPDGSTTDIVGQSWPVFIVSTPQEFLEFMHAQIASPEAVGEFVATHPRTAAALEVIGQVSDPPLSWATMTFHSAVAYRLVNADGATHFIRWRLDPEAGEHSLPEDERAGADRDYLMTEILTRGTVRFTLSAQVAEDGDVTDDSTVPWPAERELVDMGVIELTGPDLDRERDGDVLVMDAMRVTDGIEPSDDPILLVRSRAYSVSVERRTGEAPPAGLR